jgi:HEAT repeat protein
VEDAAGPKKAPEPFRRQALFVLHQDWVDSSTKYFDLQTRATALHEELVAKANEWGSVVGSNTGRGDCVHICFTDVEQAIRCARHLAHRLADPALQEMGLEIRARTVLHAGNFLIADTEAPEGFERILAVRLDSFVGPDEIWMTESFKVMLPRDRTVPSYGAEFVRRVELGEPHGGVDCYRLVVGGRLPDLVRRADPVDIALLAAEDLLDSDSDDDRLAGVRALGHLDTDRATSKLLGIVGSKVTGGNATGKKKRSKGGRVWPARIRAQALLVLPPRWGPTITAAIKSLVEDPDENKIIRQFAAQYLGNSADPEALPTLLSAAGPRSDPAKDDSPTNPTALRISALVALRHFDEPRVSDMVNAILSTDTSPAAMVKAACVAGSGCRLKQDAVDHLKKLAAGDVALDLRISALEALEAQPTGQIIVKAVRDLVDDQTQPFEVRRLAIRVAAGMADADTVDLIGQTARRAGDPLRGDAASLLATMRTGPSIIQAPQRTRLSGLSAVIAEFTLNEDDVGRIA